MSETVREQLFLLQDLKYRDFHSRLVPNIAKEKIIGVRMPDLRKLAKSEKIKQEKEEFLKEKEHYYYEEKNLHALLIETIKSPEKQLKAVESFLPQIDNWATCDILRPRALMKNAALLDENVRIWLKSEYTYTVRFAIEMLLVRFLDEDFSPEYLELVSAVKSEEYYIKMMQAWYFATALAKQYNAAIVYLTENRLEKWTHNKTIQKACESFRISQEKKSFLKTLKRC